MNGERNSGTTQEIGHLTEDQVDEVLLQFAEPETLAHLSGCAFCQGRVRSFQDSMALFNKTTLTWAEAKSSTMPPPAPSRPRRRPGWAVAAPVAACLAVGAALLVTSHHDVTSRQPAAVQVATNDTSLEPDPAQLARDNAMLQAISTEMQPMASPLSTYGTGSDHGRSRRNGEISN